MNSRVSYIRLITLFVASQAAIVILLNQRQELALLFFIPTIVVAPLLLRSGLNLSRSAALSTQVIVVFIMILAIVSNVSYFTSEIYTPFEHWIRLLFPLCLLLLATKIFRGNESEIKVFITVFMVMFGLSVFKTFDASAAIALQQGIERQTNWGNAVAANTPFIFLLRNKTLRDILLFIAVTALIISLKRTGFLSAAVLVFAYFWPSLASFRLKRGIKSQKLRAIMAGVVVIAGGAAYLTKNVQFTSYLMRAEARMMSAVGDGGSGRVGLWVSAIDLFQEGSFFELLFGRGFGWFNDNYQRLGIRNESLHSDPLDFLMSFGALGALLYLLLVNRVIGLAFAFRGCAAHASFAVSLALIFLVYSLFAGIFFYIYFFTPLLVGIGYLEAQKSNMQIIQARSSSSLVH